MPLFVGSSMMRLGLAVTAALAAAVAATVVFDGAEHERAQPRSPLATAASDTAGSPAVHEQASVHGSDPLDGAPDRATPPGGSDVLANAPGLDPPQSTAAVAEAPGSDAVPSRGASAEVPLPDAPARSAPGSERDMAVVTPPPGPPAEPASGTGPRVPASQPAAPQDTTANAADGESDAAQARRLNREGIALIDAGRPRQAIAPLERAAGLQPRDAEILDNLGGAYLLAGEHLVASRHFMRALDVAPTRSATWINLGHASAELGQRERAVHAVVQGYRYSTRKASVRAALLATATGAQYSPQWREVARLALARIDGS